MSIAASKGGHFPSPHDPIGYDIPVVRLWRDLGEGRVSGIEAFETFRASAHPVQVEVGIGNKCGQSCPRCFLSYGPGNSMERELVALDRLIGITDEFIEAFGTRIVSVVDRDALTFGRSVPYFSNLARHRQRIPDLVFGGVTNGLFIDAFADELESIHLTYLDVSLDGLRDEHDAQRGAGAFDRTVANIRLAQERQLADRILVAPTLDAENGPTIIALIEQLATEEGVRWFDMGPLMAVKTQHRQLGPDDVPRFLEQLCDRLAGIELDHEVTVIFEICAYCAAFIPGLIHHGWLRPEELRQDRYEHLYQEIQLNASTKLVLRPELIPDYFRHTVRISADGFVVGGCELLSVRDYAAKSVGNIQDESVGELYQRALRVGSPFYHMMRAYDHSACRGKSCFRHCLGGDALLAQAVYSDFNVKDPNCTWDEYEYLPTVGGDGQSPRPPFFELPVLSISEDQPRD